MGSRRGNESVPVALPPGSPEARAGAVANATNKAGPWPGSFRLDDEWILTPWRAAVHVPTLTAVLADLHLGYAAARRAVGEAVPDLNHRGWRHRLSALYRRGVRRLIVAGDLVERGCVWQAAARWAKQQARLGVAVQLVPGNHDAGLPPLAGVELLPEPLQLGRWSIRHAPPFSSHQEACLAGHLHPALRLAGFPQTVPCFLWQENAVVLPAQSDDVAGVNVLAMTDWQDARCLAVLRGQVVDLGIIRTLKRRLKAQQHGRFRH